MGQDGRIELCALNLEELKVLMNDLGEPRFRADQVAAWVKKGTEIEDMTNLSKSLREKLSAAAVTNSVHIVEILTSKLDGTEKYLFRLSDGNIIEGVHMRYHYGDTLCISTQVGCRMGCKFCASTLEGCVRNLRAGEMIGQVLAVNSHIQKQDTTAHGIHNIVMMGSGEPLDNYDESMRFLRLLNAENGLHISLRNVSLSTCGLVDKMLKLADEGLPITLSVSLHAPNDEIRKQLMPVANAYKIEDILNACSNYIEKTGRRVVFEYALVDGVNCSDSCADQLADRLRGMQCHVNVIPLNEVKERNLSGPGPAGVERFIRHLEKRHISVTKRREMGDDIQGACGQLRRSRL